LRKLLLLCGLAVVSGGVHASSLLGDHTCPQWLRMQAPAKQAWAKSFLAPLTLALKSIHGSKRDASGEASRTTGEAVASIDSYCAAHPDNMAADGAGAYFKTLVGS
jgi:hypothetical protein